ncbi:hypothetical protein JKP88DRAFT_242348 [Tribonema minus]|uniref:SAM domain-containing protein n=1 Tax=Tribonema minus TaxID=303371 RepID=A0A835YT00_9STRA|nr:hypothetical protein JKP88DRAFT_242348 [Tribonema minus]
MMKQCLPRQAPPPAASAAARDSGPAIRAPFSGSTARAADEGGVLGGGSGVTSQGGSSSGAPPRDASSLAAWVAHVLGVEPHSGGARSVSRRLFEAECYTRTTLALLSAADLTELSITGVPARLIMSAVEHLGGKAPLPQQQPAPSAAAAAAVVLTGDSAAFRDTAQEWEPQLGREDALVAALSRSLF